MSPTTVHYRIPAPVPFIDVEIAADNRLFVDPHAIRLSSRPHPFRDQALGCIDTFTNAILCSIIEGTPTARRRGEGLLQRFVEPWETRLGMAATGFRGHGGAELIGTRIWETLSSDAEALVRFGLLKQLEDLPLFVEGVDRDITSDITTRIVFGPLAQFTAHMMETYPQFTSNGHQVETFRKQVWDPVAEDWGDREMTLPVATGKPLMLVPQEWARKNLLMSATRYYETSALSFAQHIRAVRMSNGTLLTTPKDQLMKLPGFGRGRGANMRLTMEAFEKDEDLLETFRAFVAMRMSRNARGGQAAA